MFSGENLRSQIAQAIKQQQPLPAIEKDLGLDEAYSWQHEVTAHCSPGGTGGVKAGVTALAAQKHFGINHALLGSLYRDSELPNFSEIPFVEGRILECEVAVLVDKLGNPKAIAPAIEIVFVKFSRSSDLTAPNLVICNLGADSYIVGDYQAWSPAYTDLTCVLSREEAIVNQATMTDALGGAELSVPWMYQEARHRSFEFDGDTPFLTGACGKAVPALTGSYKADFGRLGKLEFSIY